MLYRTLRAMRYVENYEDINDWMRDNHVEPRKLKKPMHVTISYSRTPVEADVSDFAPKLLCFDYTRKILVFRGSTPVLTFESVELQREHEYLRENGATYDFPAFIPHITFLPSRYVGGLRYLPPFPDGIVLGPMVLEELKPGKT